MNTDSFFSRKSNPIEKKPFNSLIFTLPVLFFLLLVFLKLPVLEIYFNTITLLITLAPMAAIVGVYFYAYHKSRQDQKIKRLDYYLLILKILTVIFLFYLIYAPQEFFNFFKASLNFLMVLVSFQGLLFLAGPLAILVFLGFLIFFTYRYHQAQLGIYQKSIPQLFKNLSFSLFFILLLLGSGIVMAAPQTIKPLTDSLGDTIFTLSKGNIQVLKGTDITQYKKLSSLKDFTNSLSSSIVDTSKNLSQAVEENKETFQKDLSKSKQELNNSISETTTNLKDKLSEDIEDRLSLRGGTLSGKLTVSKDLVVKGLTEIQDTLTTNTILPADDGDHNLGSSSKGWSSLFVSRIKGSSPVIIGDGSSSLNLTDSGDLVVSEQLEVLGDTNLQNLTLNGNLTLNSGTIINDYINSITADKISDTIPITKGGTGAITSSGALNNLLPGQTANTNKFLKTDGNNTSWQNLLLSDLQNPIADLNLDLNDYTMKFNFIANSGSDNLFTLRDKDNNTGSGYLLDVYTGNSSLLNPLRISANNRNLTAIAVDSLGRVGIGTDDIDNNLSVLGDMDLIGNFGIGTSTPDSPFHIFSSDNPQLKISNLSKHFTLNLDSNGNLNFAISGDSYRFDKKVIADTLEANNFTTYAQGAGRVGDAYCQKKEVSTAGVVGDWVNINNDQVCGLNSRCDTGECIETSFVCGTSQVTDADSNIYNTVRIGDQCWMKENMRTTKYPDGTAITKGAVAHGDASWGTDQAWYSCPPNTSNNGEDCAAAATLGLLYQWSAAMKGVATAGAQGICPTGWHVPTDAEQYTLENYLTTGACSASRTDWGCDPAGAKLAGNVAGQNWATGVLTGHADFNTSGFVAPASGYRNSNGNYYNRSSNILFWSSNESGSNAWRRYLNSSNSTVSRGTLSKALGFSVRCLKD